MIRFPSPRRVLAVAATVLFTQLTCCVIAVTPVAIPSTLGLLTLAAAVAWLTGRSIRQSRLHAAQPAEKAAVQAVTADLSISVATAKAHVARLLTKLDARDRVHLVILAYEAGLVALAP